jgi:hypothetical protein
MFLKPFRIFPTLLKKANFFEDSVKRFTQSGFTKGLEPNMNPTSQASADQVTGSPSVFQALGGFGGNEDS